MRRIIYCSQASCDFLAEELVALITQARSNNQRAGLSSMLQYCRQTFLQLLEGSGQRVTAAYTKIVADERHTGVRLLADIDVAAPLSPDWTTGFENLDDEQLAREVEAFTPATDYPLVNPDLITKAVAQTLLQLYGRNRVQ